MPGILSTNRDSDDSQSTHSDSEFREYNHQRSRQQSLPPQPPQLPQPAIPIAQNQRSRNVARRGRRFYGSRRSIAKEE